MRDQLNGQLYDGWRTDCDVKSWCRFGVCRGKCDECHDDEHTHSIIPAGRDAVYDSWDDRLTE